MKKLFLILAVLMLAVPAWGQNVKTTDIYQISESVLDSAGVTEQVAESVHVMTYFGGYECIDAWYNAGDDECKAYNGHLFFFDAYGDLDADSGDGQYYINYEFIDSAGTLYSRGKDRFTLGNADVNVVSAGTGALETGDFTAGFYSTIKDTFDLSLPDDSTKLMDGIWSWTTRALTDKANFSLMVGDLTISKFGADFDDSILVIVNNQTKTNFKLASDGLNGVTQGSGSVIFSNTSIATVETVTDLADNAIDYATFAGTPPTAWWNEGKGDYSLSGTGVAAIYNFLLLDTLNGVDYRDSSFNDSAVVAGKLIYLGGDSTAYFYTGSDSVLVKTSVLDILNRIAIINRVACDSTYALYYPFDSDESKDSVEFYCLPDSNLLMTVRYIEGSTGKMDITKVNKK